MHPGDAGECLSDNMLAELVSGRLSAVQVIALEEHVDRCGDCRDLIARAALSGVAPLTRDGAEAGGGGRGVVGRRVAEGEYTLVREIARGGMGRIVEAWDARHGRAVALKLLLHDGPAARARFSREIRVTSRLQHPAVVPLYEAGELPSGEPFFAMKLVSGRSLDAVSRACGTLRERLGLLPALVAVTEAIAYAHDRRVVHRDLKPANVLVGAFGETVVLDWGLAKELDRDVLAADGDEESTPPPADDAGITVAGHALGTPAYMAPEQARGEPASERADVYALGAMLYHVLSGEPPYAGGAREIVARVLDAAPPPLRARAPEVPDDLAAIVDKAMARAPGDRYADARAMASDLVSQAAGRMVSAREYSRGAQVARWVARHRAAVATAALVVVAVAVTALVGVRRTMRERDRADAQRDAAERLVEFVVGTLKDRLVPVGKLDLLAGVGGEVNRYYASLPADRRGDGAVDADAVGRHAAALETLAQVEEAKSDNAAVITLLTSAREMRDRRTAARPDDLEAAGLSVEDDAQIASALWRQGDHGAAVARAKGASRLARELLGRAPSSDLLGRVAAQVDGTLCNFLLYVPDGPGAKDACEHGRDAALAVLGRSPDDTKATRRFARALYFLGTWETHFGTRDRALSDYGTGVRALDALSPSERARADTERLHADLLSRLGEAELQSGRLAEARDAYARSITIRTALSSRDPDNLDLRREVMVGQNGLGNYELTTADLEGARAAFTESLRIARSLVAARASDGLFQDDLGYALRNTGDVALARKDFEGARAAWSEAVDVCAAHAAAQVSPDPMYRRARYTLALGLRGLAVAEDGLGHGEAARVAFEKGKSTIDALLAEGDDRLHRKAAAALDATGADVLAHLGDARGAEALARRSFAAWDGLLGRNPTDADLASSLAESASRLAALLGAGAETRAERRTVLARGVAALSPRRDAGTLSAGDRATLAALERALARPG